MCGEKTTDILISNIGILIGRRRKTGWLVAFGGLDLRSIFIFIVRRSFLFPTISDNTLFSFEVLSSSVILFWWLALFPCLICDAIA
jgi:hypothetical protein